MTTTTATATMPIVSLAAANYVHKIGFWIEFNEMVERAMQVVPNPRSIEVTLDKTGDGTVPIVLIFVDYFPEIESEPGKVNESAERPWERWVAEKYSGDVLQHFTLIAIPLPPEDSDENGR